SRDRPPMLAPGRYPQWRLRFLRYVDTRPNGKALRKCSLSGPYKPTTILVQAVEATDDSPAEQFDCDHDAGQRLISSITSAGMVKGVSLQADQYDWLANTDEEVDEQELEAHYSYMAKIHEVPIADSGTI
nr:hypothetical protein [Tanacetum cinerariifolium]